jgi:hypothetical protein
MILCRTTVFGLLLASDALWASALEHIVHRNKNHLPSSFLCGLLVLKSKMRPHFTL